MSKKNSIVPTNPEPAVAATNDVFRVSDPMGCLPVTPEQFIARWNATANAAAHNLDFEARNSFYKIRNEFQEWIKTATFGCQFFVPALSTVVVKLDPSVAPYIVDLKAKPLIEPA